MFKKTAVTTEELNPDIVLLKIDELAQIKNKIWRGTIARALSNGNEVTEEMVKPHIIVLIEKGFIEKTREANAKWGKSAKPVPSLVLTPAGKKELERLKATQN